MKVMNKDHQSLNRRELLINSSLLCAGMIIPFKSMATTNKGKYIPSAYIHYANKNNVPAKLLYTIAHIESRYGNTKSPHIYAMNFKGKSHYFSSREVLYKNVLFLLESGFKSFDIGPVQVNWKWHSERFSNNLWAATDPERGLNAGAEYLRELFEIHNDWFVAGGKYHSPGTKPKQLKNYERYKRSLIDTYKELGYA